VYALQVHVQPQAEVRIGDVAALGDVLHVPYFTIERPTYLRKARSQLPHFTARVARIVARNAAEEEKPRALQLRDGAQNSPWIRKVVIWHFEISSRGSEQR